MKASLDTNVIIHLYRAESEEILFDFFEEIFIYEQIRNIELEHHGKELLTQIDADISSGRIKIFTDEKLKELSVYTIFSSNVKENRMLYGAGDMGEVYAISLAQTLGVYALVTDDIKQGGPYMSLLQFEDSVMPFTFADILILRYLSGLADEMETIDDFNTINIASDLNWSFRSQLIKFVKRFWSEPYRNEDREWMREFVKEHNIKTRSKIGALRDNLNKI